MTIENKKSDYLAPNLSELVQIRGRASFDPTQDVSGEPVAVSRTILLKVLPVCVAIPTIMWLLLYFGVRNGWYQPQAFIAIFAYAIAAAFGLLIWQHLKKLSRMDAARTRAQEQLQQAKDAAEDANRFKSAFFANISHEIRTPLTAINGFAELMLNAERTEAERLADARVIRRNGEHLLTLINDILDLSKIEAGKMSVERILCCPAQIIGEVCSMLRQRASEKGLTLDAKFEGPIPQRIRTDPTRLRQIVINLVANAIKFTKEGGVNVTVSITPTFKAVNPLLQVKISDTGIGISKDQQANLFQPFVQAEATINRQYGGTGLGLAISRHFAGALGGDITLESEAGQGSTFTVTVATGELGDAAVQQNPEEAMNAVANFVSMRVRIAGRVLVAEDGIDNQALISAKLRETGLTVELAPNGQIAVEKATEAKDREQPFDLILMDVQMPVMDGYTATMELRSKGFKCPIIALTANAMDRDRSRCLGAGCNDFVTKPIQMPALFKAIGKYLKVTPVTEKKTETADAATLAARAIALAKFTEGLPGELEQMNEALDREDRVGLQEITQLLLGRSAAAGLKEIAPEAAKLMQILATEQSWGAIKKAVKDFARECQPEPIREAA